MRETRGVSPLLASIILIAIVLAGGLAVWQLFFSTGKIIGETLDVLPSADIVKTQAVTLLTTTVKNAGTKHIENCTVTFYGDDNTNLVLELGAITPGGSVSEDETNPPNFSVSVGQSYPVKIWVRAPDGSTITRIFTITASA